MVMAVVIKRTTRRVCLLVALCVSPSVFAVESKMAAFSDAQQQTISEFKSLAYTTMARRYTQYSKLFNLCQQLPEDAACGERYDSAESEYLAVKSVHGVFSMLLEEGMTRLPLPEMAYREVSDALVDLGVMLKQNVASTIDANALLADVQRWQRKLQLPASEYITMLDYVMIRTDAFASDIQVQ